MEFIKTHKMSAFLGVLLVIVVTLTLVLYASNTKLNVALAQSETQVATLQNQGNSLQAQVVLLQKEVEEKDTAFWYEHLTAVALATAYVKLAPDLIATVGDSDQGPVKILVENEYLITEMFPPFGHDFSSYGPGIHDASGRNISKTLSTMWGISPVAKVTLESRK